MKQKALLNSSNGKNALKDRPELEKFPGTKAKFPMGRVFATANLRNRLNPLQILPGLIAHSRGDWGDVGAEDWEENEIALREGFRLFSVYHAQNGTKYWIITEADRSLTTVLLPEDY